MKARGRILFADNDAVFRSTRAEYLQDDYEVLEAGSVQEARQHLHDSHVHLAILDIRLTNDDDDHDLSGLLLAKDAAYRAVPKIMLTGHPSVDTLREALRDVRTGIPSAVDYLDKKEGAEALVQTVAASFANHVRLNLALSISIDERQPLSLLSLVTLITPVLEEARLQQRTDELADVLRRVFYTQTHIRLDRLLWKRSGRVALRVLAFQEGAVPEAFVVVCGSSAAMASEALRYADGVPKAMDGAGTVLSTRAETVHLAAQAYQLADTALEHTQSLLEVYQRAPEKVFNTALEHLVQHTLRRWHQDKRVRVEPPQFDTLYRERLGWDAARATMDGAAAVVQALAQQLPTLGMVVEYATQTWHIRLGGHTWSGPNPLLVLQQPLVLPQPVLLSNTPGTLSGDNILTDATGRTWLTDFADAGLAPQVWPVVALEAAIRFDWVESHDLQALQSLERCLGEQAFDQLDGHDLNPALRKALRAIQTVRRLARPMLDGDPVPYQYGLLYQVLHRLLACQPTGPWSSSELARYGQVLLAAAWLYHTLQGATPGAAAPAAPAEAGLRIDAANRRVLVHGVPVPVPAQSYELLYYMYTRAGQLCTRRQLMEEALKEPRYDEEDTSQVNRLNAAIRRLRERIEAQPGQPRYLHTEAGHGYRLERQ